MTGSSTSSGGFGRWDALEQDLDAQAAAAHVAERRAEAAESGRAEVAAVRLVDRLRAALDSDVVVVARGCGPVRGSLAWVGSDCVAVVDGRRETVVALVACLSVSGLGPEAMSARAVSAVDARLGLASTLRRIARDRAAVRVVLDTGDVVHGTVDAVGADHVDIAEHPPGEPRRRAGVVARRVVPLAALAAVVRG